MKMHPMTGVSLSIAIGRWATPHIKLGTYTARICLGFVGITFWTLDLEDFMKYLADTKANQKEYRNE